MSPAARSWAIAAIAFIGGVGGGTAFPILPVVGLQLGIPGFMIGLILAANRITRLGFNPVTGSLLDRFGARGPVAAGLLIEAVGTTIFAWALTADHPAAWFLAGRVIWGVGSSLLLVGALAAVMAIAPRAQRGGMTARVRTAISLGLPAGLVIGGLVAAMVSDNAAFLTASGLSVIGAVLAWLLLPARAVRVAGGLRGQAPTSGRTDWRTLMGMPTLRIIWAANALLFFAVSGVLLASVSLFVAHRQLDVFGYNAQGSAGLLMAVLMLARAAAALACGRYLDRSAARTRLLLPAMALLFLGFGGLAVAHATAVAVVALLAIGLGSGGLTIPLLTLLGDVTPHRLHGRALSIYQWSSDFGGAFGPVLALVCGERIGFGWTYAAVAMAVLGMVVPLRWLAVRERAGAV